MFQTKVVKKFRIHIYVQ